MAKTPKAEKPEKEVTPKAEELEVEETATTPEVEATPEAKEEKPVSKKYATQAVVLNARGGEERVYSVEKHGKDFEALANEFVSNPKREGYTVKLR